MSYCAEYCIDMPDDFPVVELVSFMVAARRVLLQPKGAEWREFAGASNLIGWRYRASFEDWCAYKDSWNSLGVAVDHEVGYCRERTIFGMFTSGVACLESAAYAIAALASHPRVLAIRFGPKEQRQCSLKHLAAWLELLPAATALESALSSICVSDEWRLWVDLRNRMTHRSNLPRVIFGTIGGPALPPAKALHYASTSSTPIVEGDLETFDALHDWLSRSLKTLLIEATRLCPA